MSRSDKIPLADYHAVFNAYSENTTTLDAYTTNFGYNIPESQLTALKINNDILLALAQISRHLERISDCMPMTEDK